MFGLIKKDLFTIKGNIKSILIIFFVFLVLSVYGENDFSFMPIFLSIIMMMSSFSYDEFNKADAYISTLPKGRKNAVKAKYLATLLLLGSASLVTFILSLLMEIRNNSFALVNIWETTIGCLFAAIFIQAIIYPLIYKFGIEKSRIGLFVGAFGIAAIFTIISKLNIKVSLPTNLELLLNQYALYLMILAVLVLLLLSYKISEHIYLRKEF